MTYDLLAAFRMAMQVREAVKRIEAKRVRRCGYCGSVGNPEKPCATCGAPR